MKKNDTIKMKRQNWKRTKENIHKQKLRKFKLGT